MAFPTVYTVGPPVALPEGFEVVVSPSFLTFRSIKFHPFTASRLSITSNVSERVGISCFNCVMLLPGLSRAVGDSGYRTDISRDRMRTHFRTAPGFCLAVVTLCPNFAFIKRGRPSCGYRTFRAMRSDMFLAGLLVLATISAGTEVR